MCVYVCYDSVTGKKLMSKCRSLLQENQELGKQISQGRVVELEAEIELHKKHCEELKSFNEGHCFILNVPVKIKRTHFNLVSVCVFSLAHVNCYIFVPINFCFFIFMWKFFRPHGSCSNTFVFIKCWQKLLNMKIKQNTVHIIYIAFCQLWSNWAFCKYLVGKKL